MTRTAFTVALALAVAHSAAAQDSTTASVDRVFAAFARPDVPGCALGVYRDGLIIYSRGYGAANIAELAGITPKTIFDIGSTSKQFTAASIILLAQQGRLSLDDDVRRFIPELPQYQAPITIRHLLHHTSGVRDYIGLLTLGGADIAGRTTAKQALDAIVRQKALNFTPGTEHLYSNSGYFLLSQIVERVSGQSMRAFADENIFRPLAMTSTHYATITRRPLPARRWRMRRAPRASTSTCRSGSRPATAPCSRPSKISCAGTIISTTQRLAGHGCSRSCSAPGSSTTEARSPRRLA